MIELKLLLLCMATFSFFLAEEAAKPPRPMPVTTLYCVSLGFVSLVLAVVVW